MSPAPGDQANRFPVVERLSAFDRQSGSWPERLLFNHRPWVVLICAAATLLLGWKARTLTVNADYSAMIPIHHPYLVNARAESSARDGLGNRVRVVVEARGGSVLDRAYLERLRAISDELFLLPGVDRPFFKSLWSSSTRWMAITEEGLEGGPVIDDDYDGSPDSLERVRAHIELSGEIGHLVAADWQSTAILIPLLERDPNSRTSLDYGSFARRLEAIRAKYEGPELGIHVVGFAAIVGALIAGTEKMVAFFAATVVITFLLLWAATHSLRNAALVVACSLTAVLWLLGVEAWLGRALDPYSILVPFLVFAIGVSHGVQKMNGIAQDIGRGTHKLVAARYTFRRLFVAGLAAVLAAAAGFAALTIAPIGVIRALAATATLGVGMLVITNLVLLPVLLSWVGVAPKAARRSLGAEVPRGPLASLAALTGRKAALTVLAGAVAVAALAIAVGQHLAIGDLDAGAPELRPDSSYNRDNAFVVSHYAASSDELVVMVKTPPYECTRYATLAAVDALEQRLRHVPGVLATSSLAGFGKRFVVGLNEGNWKWYELPRDQATRNALAARAPRELMGYQCDLLRVSVFLHDHRAPTLRRVVDTVTAFTAEQAGAMAGDANAPKFLLAAGNAGIDAATNQVVAATHPKVTVLVYAAMLLICFGTFRSWRAVACAAVPLGLSLLICQAVMVLLGIGVKVATLPVIAVGVGVGVDHALYILSVTLAGLRRGESFANAYRGALLFTGKVVLLSSVTLALAVASWAFSPIKLQADMGILLACMFIANMAGALLLIPALGRFLLRPRADRVAHGEPPPVFRTSAV